MQIKTLYIYWVDFKANNYLVGEIRQCLSPEDWYYEIEYYDDCIDYITSKVDYFFGVSGCPHWQRHFARYRKRLPWFILERTPNSKRPDLPRLLQEAGMKYYDRWAYMIWNRGVYLNDRFYVSTRKDDLDFWSDWLHRYSLETGVE